MYYRRSSEITQADNELRPIEARLDHMFTKNIILLSVVKQGY